MEGTLSRMSIFVAVYVLLAMASAEEVKLKSNPDGNLAEGWEKGYISVGKYSVSVPEGEPKQRRTVQIRAPGVKDSVSMTFGPHTIVFSDWAGQFMLGDRVYTDQLGVLYFPTSDNRCDKKTYQILAGEPQVVDNVKLNKEECEGVRAKVESALSKFLTAKFEFKMPRAPIQLQHTPGFPGGDYISGMAYGTLHCGQHTVELPTGDYEKKRSIKIRAPGVEQEVDMVVDYNSKVFGSWDGVFYMADKVFSVKPGTLVIKREDGSCVEKVYESDGSNVKVKDSHLLKDEDCFLIRSKAYAAYQKLMGQQTSDDKKPKERTLIIKVPKESPPPIHIKSTVVLPNRQAVTTSGGVNTDEGLGSTMSGGEKIIAQVQTNDMVQSPPGTMYVQQDGNGGTVVVAAPPSPTVNVQANTVDPTQPGSTIHVQANTVDGRMVNTIMYDSTGQAYVPVSLPQPTANVQVTNVGRQGPVILAESSGQGTLSGQVPSGVQQIVQNAVNNGQGKGSYQYTTQTPQGTYVVNVQKTRKKRSVDALEKEQGSRKRVRRSLLQQQPPSYSSQVMTVDGQYLKQTTQPTKFVNVQGSRIVAPIGANGQPLAPDMKATHITTVTMPPGNGQRQPGQSPQPILINSKVVLDQDNAQNAGIVRNPAPTQQYQVISGPSVASAGGVNVQLNGPQPGKAQPTSNVQINEVPAVTYVMNLKTKEIQPLRGLTLPNGQILTSAPPPVSVSRIQVNTPQGSTNYILKSNTPTIPDNLINDIKKLKEVTDPTNLIVNIAESTNFHRIKKKK